MLDLPLDEPLMLSRPSASSVLVFSSESAWPAAAMHARMPSISSTRPACQRRTCSHAGAARRGPLPAQDRYVHLLALELGELGHIGLKVFGKLAVLLGGEFIRRSLFDFGQPIRKDMPLLLFGPQDEVPE